MGGLPKGMSLPKGMGGLGGGLPGGLSGLGKKK
jgi:signal recognition particle subunit SRP54